MRETFSRMARVVDGQNAAHPACRLPADNPRNAATPAAMDLVFKREAQLSGCTEPLLQAWRLNKQMGVHKAFPGRH